MNITPIKAALATDFNRVLGLLKELIRGRITDPAAAINTIIIAAQIPISTTTSDIAYFV